MARIGLKYPVAALATETGSSISYSAGAVVAMAILANIKINQSNIKLPADDKLAELDQSFIDGTISFGADDLSDAIKVLLLGYTEGAEVDAVIGSKELSAGSATTSPFVGFGFYGKRVKAGVNSWRAIWLKKVKFAEPADESKTKGTSVEFQTPTLEGTIMVAADDRWKEEGTFSSEANAVAWLNTKSGYSAAASTGLTALAMSNGTITPIFDATKYNYNCVATGDVAVTATAAGVIKLYVDGVYNQTLVTTVAGVAVVVASGASKLFTIVVQESGKSAKTTTVVVQRA